MKKSLLYGLLFWALCNISFKWYTLWRQELEPIFLPHVVELLVYFSAGIFFLHFNWKHSFWFLLPALGVSITLLFTIGDLTGLIHWAFIYTGFNLGKTAYLQWNKFFASSPKATVSQAG